MAAATVPGLGLKINEKEFMKFIFFIKLSVSSKSSSVSPGYPIIKSLENSIEGLIFLRFINIYVFFNCMFSIHHFQNFI